MQVLSTDQWAMYRSNGVDRTTGAAGTFCNPPLTINYVEGSDFMIAAVLVYNVTLTADQITTMETWLVQRYGLGKLHSPSACDANQVHACMMVGTQIPYDCRVARAKTVLTIRNCI